MGNPLELTAAAAEDPHLDERLRAESPESRSRLLLEADGLRLGGERQRRLAAVVYGALHEDVDPADPRGAARAAWFVGQLDWLAPAAAPLVRRTATTCADPEARLRATVLAARYAEIDGEVAEADELLRSVVESVRGTGSQLEFTALHHIARVAADHEDCARALSYSSRALDLEPPGLPPDWIALARTCRADAFATMRDAPRCERELRAAELVLPRLDRGTGRARRAQIAASRARALLLRGEPERALRHLDEALDDGGESSPHRTRTLHVLGAKAALELGRADTAASHVARALRTSARDDVLDLEVDLLEVRLQRVAGGAASARPRAVRFLCRLASVGRRAVGPDRRTRLAVEAARILGAPDGDAGAARRAWDLAVSSVVESVSRAIRDGTGCPEAARLDPDDLAALRGHRDREVTRHADLERAVAAFLDGAARRHGPSFLGRLAGSEGLVRACAWCGRIRGPRGAWLPIAHYLPSEDAVEVTHGICEECAGRVRASAPAAHSVR